jgi:hypothetical protein
VALLPFASDKKPIIIFVVKILPEVDGISHPPNPPPPLAAPAPEIAAVKALLLIKVVVVIVSL